MERDLFEKRRSPARSRRYLIHLSLHSVSFLVIFVLAMKLTHKYKNQQMPCVKSQSVYCTSTYRAAISNRMNESSLLTSPH